MTNEQSQGKGKPDKPSKKAQGKILILVSNIPADTTQLTATLQVADNPPITKTVDVDDVTDVNEEDDEMDAQGIMFNKLDLKQDETISANVNGTTADGKVTSTKGRPNRITVSLS